MKKLRVRVKVRSAKDEIVGYDEDGFLVVRISAPPAAGKANARLIELLAKALNVPKNNVKIVRGTTSRRKLLEVPDIVKLPERN